MKNILLAFCFLFISLASFGQQFSQYNTGTLYDAFENPSQASFIPDSSRQFAFNFFIPNFNSNLYVTGNGQVPLKSRAFLGKYVGAGLTLGEGKFSRANISANVYSLMFRSFRSLDGDQEVGFSIQTRAEGRGIFTDESLLLLNSSSRFTNPSYDELFNNSYTYQTYHQFSATYREKVSKTFSFGVKLSALLGIQYQQLQIDHSNIDFNRAADQADLTLQGKYRINFTPGQFVARDILPSFRSPGASISLGSTIRTRDNFNIQFNVKDLGFIHWYSKSTTSNFNTTRTIQNISGSRREDNLYANTFSIIRSGDTQGSYVTPTNGKIELSANKSYWFNYDRKLKYSPTLILQKEIFYDSYTAALVNPFQYNNLVGTLTTSVNNYGLFNAGLQFMVKTPNVEFYIGSDRVIETANLFRAGVGKSDSQINKNSAFTGADFFLGFSLKFGNVIEHPTNANFIPMGEKPGLFKRIWNSVFHRNDDDGT
ncbi:MULTISPECIES: DUF5723 family protein [unclassified Mucilaginibacter]|uniref:DUF5723 family protein n=1 Tax=unclassified Mucilaginibacter TaxID=2617802 RepID=UPI002AC90BCC|nr:MULTISPECIES: DUF5723 family protein [unclassified Mucilaginibacter]MEB0260230.1 DUF5723 family protein [Mucilaginibacter sp. 10I4]MEB0277359.1 DUF5723 family protein [Mucilaginibacter sp. 10B2]MEB0300159.1 DUF5723 family protein [Mucilaginibacter sp. 5C4]WPX25483.1 DUF5723 family protein [Mucilaginibacter sp. 5C4]